MDTDSSFWPEANRMDLQALLDDPPLIHECDGKLLVWGMSRSILDFIDAHVNQNSKTLETGCGQSTILFAMKGAHHICINPWQSEVDRIKDYCVRHGIPTDRLDFRVDLSVNVLPKIADDQLDFALIDGAHSFPNPFIDWYFISSQLKTGGILLVDDIRIWTGRVLKDFLLGEPEWKLIGLFEENTAVFLKQHDYRTTKDWGEQPYVVQQSAPPPELRQSKFQKGMSLLRQGKVLTLARKIARG
jgi:predicted O-methyltransferase YrrM